MLLVRQQRAPHVALIVKLAGFVAVVHGEEEAAAQPAPCVLDPVTGGKPRFSLLAFDQTDALRMEIFRKGWRRGWAGLLAEFLTVQAHVELAKRSLRAYHTMHRKCVEQLIREDAARGDLRGQLRCRAGPAGFEMRTERSRLGRAAAVVAVLGVVEALAHELGKGQGAAPANPPSE